MPPENVRNGAKNGLMELQKLLDRIFFNRRTWVTIEDAQKAKTDAPPTQSNVTAEWPARIPMEIPEEAIKQENSKPTYTRRRITSTRWDVNYRTVRQMKLLNSSDIELNWVA